MLLLDLAHVADSLTLLSAFLGWPDASRHLVIVLEMLGDFRSTKEIGRIFPILFLPGALFLLKAEELCVL